MYKIAKDYKEALVGGKGDNKSDKEFDKKALKDGIKEEKEHTSNLKIRKEIAKDHLSQDKNYYTKLLKLEKKAKNPTPAKPYESLPGAAKVRSAIANAGGVTQHAIREPEGSIKLSNLTTAGLALGTSVIGAHLLSRKKPGDYDDGSTKGERLLSNLGPAAVATAGALQTIKHLTKKPGGQ